MKKKDLLELVNSLDVDDDTEFMLGDIRHAWELKPALVCGMGQAWMVYYCVKEPNHDGKCYCSIKNVYFTPETKEEIKALHDSIK